MEQLKFTLQTIAVFVFFGLIVYKLYQLYANYKLRQAYVTILDRFKNAHEFYSENLPICKVIFDIKSEYIYYNSHYKHYYLKVSNHFLSTNNIAVINFNAKQLDCGRLNSKIWWELDEEGTQKRIEFLTYLSKHAKW